ncbi:MAG: hypothetical protein ABI836_01960 [Gemmatimonadota bacterium]
MRGVVIYLLLVGIPVAGVIGVLEVGRRITPPPFLGGTWALAISADSSCGGPAPADSLTMVISQSGTHIAVNFPGSTLPELKGRAMGDSIRVAGNADSVQLNALVEDRENRMSGILRGVPAACAGATMVLGTRATPPGADAAH